MSLQRKGVLKIMNLKIFSLVRFHIGHFITNEDMLKSLEHNHLVAFIAKKIRNSMV